jgi:cell division protein FtsA
MMDKEKYIVGLDIGTTKIVAMVGRLNEHGKVEVLGTGKAKSMGVQRGVVSNISLTIESIKTAVQEAEQRAGVKIEEVVVGIAGQHIRSLQHSDYIIRTSSEEVIGERDIQQLEENVNKLVMLPGEQIIHVLPQKYPNRAACMAAGWRPISILWWGKLPPFATYGAAQQMLASK